LCRTPAQAGPRQRATSTADSELAGGVREVDYGLIMARPFTFPPDRTAPIRCTGPRPLRHKTPDRAHPNAKRTLSWPSPLNSGGRAAAPVRCPTRQLNARHSGIQTDSFYDFRSAIAQSPPELQNDLVHLTNWAESLEAKGLARLATRSGTPGTMNLKPLLHSDGVALVTITWDTKPTYASGAPRKRSPRWRPPLAPRSRRKFHLGLHRRTPGRRSRRLPPSPCPSGNPIAERSFAVSAGGPARPACMPSPPAGTHRILSRKCPANTGRHLPTAASACLPRHQEQQQPLTGHPRSGAVSLGVAGDGFEPS
jgi:hypothetical protein